MEPYKFSFTKELEESQSRKFSKLINELGNGTVLHPT